MATEETGLNEALAAVGCTVTETDLGEWIIQLAGEHPSHIIAPAVHRNRHQIADTFQAEAGLVERTTEPSELVGLRPGRAARRFVEADLGITGANLGVAETGSIVLVTNEGNGRMVTSLPKVHVAVMGAERVVSTWEEADLILGLLSKAATGQLLTTYTSITTGPRQPGEVDGPEEFHLVILDNGRSDIAGTEFAEMLNCIRCGACLNVCPVYRQTGGHAYGWVYSGPMGAVLTPLLATTDPHAAELGNASSLCGACREACPVDIPLPDLLLATRRRKAATARGRSGRCGRRGRRRGRGRARSGVGLGGHTRPAVGAAPAPPPRGRPWTDTRAAPTPPADLHRAVEGRRDLMAGTETGDRAAFLGRIRARQGPPPAIGPHPPPPPPDVVPEVGYPSLDGVTDLPAAFADAARRASVTVHTHGLVGALAAVVEEHGVRHAVVSHEPEAQAARGPLEALGVEVADHDPAVAVDADLGVTGAVAAIAATGSVVVVGRGRWAGRQPPADRAPLHRRGRLGGGHAERRVPPGGRPLPSNRVIITGPSRTGDIEQIITLGAHGPVAVHVVLV